MYAYIDLTIRSSDSFPATFMNVAGFAFYVWAKVWSYKALIGKVDSG